MRTKANWLSRLIVLVAVGLVFAGASSAQTTTTVDVREFEVISVDGNKLVVRDQKGTNEYTVPDDFRFTVDGKKMAASELKPGMKGSATITTTTTIRPVTITELREAEVLRASDLSVTIRGADGDYRRYSQGELDKTGVEIFKDGKAVRLADLKRGDKLTAIIVTSGPPVVLTAKEVEATLAESKSEPTPTQMAANTSAAPAATPTAPPQASAAPPAAPTSDKGTMWYWIIAVLVVAAVFFFMRRKKES